MQCTRAENKNESNCDLQMLHSRDTLLPISVIASDKMNIMVDNQKELIALQWKGLNREDRNVILTDSTGKIYDQKQMYAGSTIVYFETQALYEGNYILKVSDKPQWINKNIKITKPE
ncbi:MAG: hypothetical protein WCH52_09730 [Bacteroidota bacterium]